MGLVDNGTKGCIHYDVRVILRLASLSRLVLLMILGSHDGWCACFAGHDWIYGWSHRSRPTFIFFSSFLFLVELFGNLAVLSSNPTEVPIRSRCSGGSPWCGLLWIHRKESELKAHRVFYIFFWSSSSGSECFKRSRLIVCKHCLQFSILE